MLRLVSNAVDELGYCLGHINGVCKASECGEISLFHLPQITSCYCKFPQAYWDTVLSLLILYAVVDAFTSLSLQIHSAVDIDIFLDILASKYFKYIDVRYVDNPLFIICILHLLSSALACCYLPIWDWSLLTLNVDLCQLFYLHQHGKVCENTGSISRVWCVYLCFLSWHPLFFFSLLMHNVSFFVCVCLTDVVLAFVADRTVIETSEAENDLKER